MAKKITSDTKNQKKNPAPKKKTNVSCPSGSGHSYHVQHFQKGCYRTSTLSASNGHAYAVLIGLKSRL